MGAPRKADWREERRKRAWSLKEQGWQQQDIAVALGVSEGAVSQWLKRGREGGVEALQAHPPKGMTPRLRADQRAQLPALLAQGAEAYGFRDDVPCCISVMVQGHAPHAEPILYPDEVIAVLGYLPAQVIEISAGCNRRLDHYQVGHLALHFAQTYDGIIDMVGEITPAIPPNHEMYPWHHLEEIRAFVQGMPGMIWEVFFGSRDQSSGTGSPGRYYIS
jgi:hypothetical protein